MSPTKGEIKAWLKEFGHTREWLGQQCGNLTLKAVNNWLSTDRPIPSGALTLISRLMEDDEAADLQRKQLNLPANQIFSLEVSLEDFRRYSRAALAAGLTLEDWAIEECNRASLRNQSPASERGKAG